ncbi:MarR family transcriptional regulator [Streptomyces sp. ASQP_92]|uniref:MarR family winged helix-turn-helix transcriptional regulator n=1 Tax=Streptomyces sp. ASQP_92 TaxID=2979116 RepID=UPI0021C02AA3|nr:MarR family transcriptional regulator [Streptomyces sp. ASQP_92]MCT9089972.1 MarR family transcriptional regulator [Streptomyces sp. ASQP_92]
MSEQAEALVATWIEAERTAVPRLSGLQLQALLITYRSPGINLTGMAEQVGAAPPTVSRLCDRLEAAGLLVRHRATTSRREIGLTLTAHGYEMLAALTERRFLAVRRVLQHVPAAQREALLAGLRAFSEATEPATGGGPDL